MKVLKPLTFFIYWLVYMSDKPIALVRCGQNMANTVAGDKTIARDYEKRKAGAFTDGKPDTVKRPDLCFQLIGRLEPWHPFITDWIKTLGEPTDGVVKRLEESRRRSKAASRVFADSEIAEMRRLRSNGLSYRKIGKRLGCGATTVREHLTCTKIPKRARAPL